MFPLLQVQECEPGGQGGWQEVPGQAGEVQEVSSSLLPPGRVRLRLLGSLGPLLRHLRLLGRSGENIYNYINMLINN